MSFSSCSLAEIAVGRAFIDANQNGLLDSGEIGLPNVHISDGTQVVLTHERERYEIAKLLKGSDSFARENDSRWTRLGPVS